MNTGAMDSADCQSVPASILPTSSNIQAQNPQSVRGLFTTVHDNSRSFTVVHDKNSSIVTTNWIGSKTLKTCAIPCPGTAGCGSFSLFPGPSTKHIHTVLNTLRTRKNPNEPRKTRSFFPVPLSGSFSREDFLLFFVRSCRFAVSVRLLRIYSIPTLTIPHGKTR